MVAPRGLGGGKDLKSTKQHYALPPPENLIAEKEKIYKLIAFGYLYLDIQGILKSHVPKSGW